MNELQHNELKKMSNNMEYIRKSIVKTNERLFLISQKMNSFNDSVNEAINKINILL